MSYLEEKLRKRSRQAGDFLPPSGQWEAIRERLKQGTASQKQARFPFWIFFLAMGFLAIGAVGKYWWTSDQIKSSDSFLELGSLPIPLKLAVDTLIITQKNIQEKQLSPTSPSIIIEHDHQVSPIPTPLSTSSVIAYDLKDQVVEQKEGLAISEDTAEFSTGSNISSELISDRTTGMKSETEAEVSPELALKTITEPLSKDQTISRAIGTSFSHRLEELTRLELPALIPLTKVKRKRKRPAPKHWYFQSSLGALPRPIEGFTSVYQADPRVGVSPVAIPIQGTNQWLEMYIVNEQYWAKGSTRWDKVLNFTFGRQFQSGWDISIGAMLYTETNKADVMLAQAAPKSGEAHLFEHSYNQAIYSEVSIRYIFRRRHRFKPYLGASLIGILYDKSVREEWFYYPDRSIAQLTNQITAQVNGVFLNSIPIPRAGFQYSLDHRWQIGLDVVFIFPSMQVQYNFR